MNPHFDQFKKSVTDPWKFRFFMLRQLPLAFFAGLRLSAFDEKHAVVAVRYRWFNRNPFHSMYFAIQSMAAEMSTGLLGFARVYRHQPAISMLVTGIEGHFYKKVTGTVFFSCHNGEEIGHAIQQAIVTGEGVAVRCLAVGRNEEAETVAEFTVTWSFKVKK